MSDSATNTSSTSNSGSSTSSSDLEIVLDKVDVDCPALVKERLLASDQDSLSLNSSSSINEFHWFLSGRDIFIWKVVEGLKVSCAHCLVLPNSGLPFTARHVLVFENADKMAAAIAVNPEGVVRFWDSVQKKKHHDTTLDLNNEVVLSVHLIESPTKESGALFAIVTTSGNVCTMRCDSHKLAEFSRVGDHDSRGSGFRKRISQIFGVGRTGQDSTHVKNSLLFWRESEEEEETFDPVVIALAANQLYAYDISNSSRLWSLREDELLKEQMISAIEVVDPRVKEVDVKFIDLQRFRTGIMVLAAVTHESSICVRFVLIYYDKADFRLPNVQWYSYISLPPEVDKRFDSDDESSFVGQIRLCIPPESSKTGVDRTDGIIVLHQNFVLAVCPPEDLKPLNQLQFNRSLFLNEEDSCFIGFGTNDRYCFVMQSNGMISTVRLLPKGLDDSSSNNVSLVDIIPDFQSADPNSQQLHLAFSTFATKDIAKTRDQVQSLLDVEASTLISVVQHYLINVLATMDPDAVIDAELQEKRTICSRFVVFLRHMGLLDKISDEKIVVFPETVSRSGASILAEMQERVAGAKALNDWRTTSEENSDALDLVSEYIAKTGGFKGGDDFIIQKLSVIHKLPAAAVEKCKSLLSKIKTVNDRHRLITVFSEMLKVFYFAIEDVRHIEHTLKVPKGQSTWTNGQIAEAYLQMCVLLVNELKRESISVLDKARLCDSLMKLVRIHLEESAPLNRPDGHPILLALYELGYDTYAAEYAETYRDFKTICRICLEMEKDERIKRLEAYKETFRKEDFDIYLCKYLQRKNLHEELLEQQGDRVDKFLSSFDSIRWRRELQNGNFDKASLSLMSLANRETKDVDKQKAFFALGKLAALCTDDTDDNLVEESDVRMEIISYQQQIPSNLVQLVFPDNPTRPMTTHELIELYKLYTAEHKAPLEAFINGLNLIAIATLEDERSEYDDNLADMWANAASQTDWRTISSFEQFTKAPVGQLFTSIGQESNRKRRNRMLPIPSAINRITKALPSDSKNFEKWFRRSLDAVRAIDSLAMEE